MLAGEDQNDCQILAELIRAHRPDLSDTAKLVRINDPVRLRRKSGTQLAAAVQTLAGKARAKALRERADLLGFVVHEDLDGYADAGYDRIRKALADELARQCPEFRTALALAAWESESWLLLFPDAFPHVRPRWKVPAKLLDKDTGRIRDAKEELKRGLGLPVFRESDGPAVARAALTRRLIPSPRGGNRSYDDFVGDLAGWT
ncbi:hypothetical protein [Streptomyces regalis]|uniref:Uncharacterized protein n=1 Tax=Streptomyces regalis TaxID=68262 RepID=A0A101J8P2_9ACTN|nr:hypothetical protein [Streptomyces regalis]KUL22253.1 hypothetical protein ADL12_43080 [Streptomyces regalis]